MQFDLLVKNGEIYSMSEPGEVYHAMGIKNGIITELFHDSPEGTGITRKLLDLGGKTVLPGLIDSHAHFLQTAVLSQIAFPLSEMVDGRIQPDSIEQVGEKVMKIGNQNPANSVLIFDGYITSSVKEDRLPYKEEIDEWFPDRIVIFLTIGGHSASFSSRALEAAGVNPENSNGILDESNPEFTNDNITKMVTDRLTTATILNGIQNTVNDAIGYGLVGIHCLDGGNPDPEKDEMLGFIKNYGSKLPLKLRLYPQIKDAGKLDSLIPYMRSPRIGGCGDLCVDGAVSAKTAAFYQPYLDDPENNGEILYPYPELVQDLKKMHKKGAQATIHAIGTKALDHLINAMDETLKDAGDTANKHRFRIDHFEFPSKEAITRAITDLNLIVVPQPGFNWVDYNYPGMQLYENYLPPEVLELQNPLRSILDKGGIICGSSDSPVQPLNPFLQIHGMVNFPIESESISVYEAFRTYTYNGAYATFEEDTRGTLEKGKEADFIVLDKNPFKIPKTELLDLKVQETYIDGKKIQRTNSNPWIFLLKTMLRKRKKI